MTEIETTLRQLIAQIVDERIGSAVARGGGRHGPHLWGVRQPRHGGQNHGGKPADRGQAAAGGGAGIRALGGGAGAIHRGAAGDGTGHGASHIPRRAAHGPAGSGLCTDRAIGGEHMQKARNILRGLAAMAGVVLLMAAGGGTGAEIWACAVPGLTLIWIAGR